MNWRASILKEITPAYGRLILVADPDRLLLEEKVVEAIQQRGFELLSFEDPVAFRYVYETRFRACWDREEEAYLVVRVDKENLFKRLPYDLLQIGHHLSFSLNDIFPGLNYAVIKALDRHYFDVLFEAQERNKPASLSERETKHFILQHVFRISPEAITRAEDLLHILLRLHYRKERLPEVFESYFIETLRQKDTFSEWPLEAIVPDAQAFFMFLQERWPVFLDAKAHVYRKEVHEPKFVLAGPSLLPFDDPDILVYLDNLFAEELLKPVAHEKAEVLIQEKGITYGILTNPETDRRRRLKKLLEKVINDLPGEDANYKDWLRFAYQWAQLNVLATEEGLHKKANDALQQQIRDVTTRVDENFLKWICQHYKSLSTLPATNPVMLHHLPRFFAHMWPASSNTSNAVRRAEKLALVVVDGLALDQWMILRRVLQMQQKTLHFNEQALFAWIPTVTSVSRQAIFAGSPPLYFAESIYQTNREESHCKQFWEDRGLAPQETEYRLLSEAEDLEEVRSLLEGTRVRVVGLVVNKIDRIIHGTELGIEEMHADVQVWAEQGFMRDLLNILHRYGFRVFLTADHGNIEARGIGQPKEGAVAEMRGERVRVYDRVELRDRVHAHFPESLRWPPVGLPENYLALIAPPRAAFVQKGKRLVTHGGISVEEVIVPFVEIGRDTKKEK
jgi:hypothetical protein